MEQSFPELLKQYTSVAEVFGGLPKIVSSGGQLSHFIVQPKTEGFECGLLRVNQEDHLEYRTRKREFMVAADRLPAEKDIFQKVEDFDQMVARLLVFCEQEREQNPMVADESTDASFGTETPNIPKLLPSKLEVQRHEVERLLYGMPMNPGTATLRAQAEGAMV